MRKEEKIKIILLSVILLLVILMGIWLISGKLQKDSNSGERHRPQKKTVAEEKANDFSQREESAEESADKEESSDTDVKQTRIREEKSGEITGDWENMWETKEGMRILTYRDNLTIWSAENGKLLEEVESKVLWDYEVHFGFLDREGKIWVLCKDKEAKNILLELEGAEGKIVQRLELTGDESASLGNRIENISIDEKGIYIASWDQGKDSSEKLNVYTGSGEYVSTEEGIRDFVWMEEGKLLTYESKEGSHLEILKMTDEGMITEERKPLKMKGKAAKVRCNGDRKEVYLLTAKGIEKVITVEDELETEAVLVFSSDAMQISADYNPVDFYVDDKGRMRVLYLVYGGKIIGKELFQYESYEIQESTECLTITMPYEIPLVNTAVNLYEKKYPNRQVKVETNYRNEAEYHEYSSAYSEKMSVRLMAGDYGDIILSSHGIYSMDRLMTDTFLDLTDWITTTENYENLDKGMLEAAKVKGTLRGIPVAVSHSYMLANEDMVQAADQNGDGQLTWSELLQQAFYWQEKGISEKYLFGQQNEFSLMSMLSSNIYDLVDPVEKTMELRQDWFLALMENWKRAENLSCVAMPEELGNPSEEVIYAAAMKNGAMLSTIRHINEGQARGRLEKNALLYDQIQEQAGTELQMLKGIAGEKNRNFDDFPMLFFSVNPVSRNQEIALDFLEVLLSEEVQQRMDYNLIPLSKEAREERLIQAKKSGVPLPDEQLEQFYEQLEQTCEQIDWMYSYSYYLTDLFSEMQAYVDGKYSLDEAISRAEEKIWIRMNE